MNNKTLVIRTNGTVQWATINTWGSFEEFYPLLGCHTIEPVHVRNHPTGVLLCDEEALLSNEIVYNFAASYVAGTHIFGDAALVVDDGEQFRPVDESVAALYDGFEITPEGVDE